LVAQALIAYKGKPTKAPWVENDKDPFEALATFQLGCESPAADRGAYYYPGIPGPNVFATVQAVVAQAKRKLPVPKTNPTPLPVVTLTCPA
jgi:hypothetical protein